MKIKRTIIILMLFSLVGCRSIELDGLKFENRFGSWVCYDSVSQAKYHLFGEIDSSGFSGQVIGLKEMDTVHVSNYKASLKHGSLFHVFGNVKEYREYSNNYLLRIIEIVGTDTSVDYKGYENINNEGIYELTDCLYMDKFCGKWVKNGEQRAYKDSCVIIETYEMWDFISVDTVCSNPPPPLSVVSNKKK